MKFAKPLSVLRHYRALCFHDGALYLSRLNQIYKSSDGGKTIQHVGSLKISPIKAVLGAFSLVRRVLRAQIYRVLFTDNSNLIALFRGGVFVLPRGSSRGWCSFRVTEGSRPISLAYRPGGMVVWGEYVNNVERRAIHVYGSSDEGLTWKVIHTFPAGAIRHVHGITYDRWDDCFWVCTGDLGQEPALYRASSDFSNVEPVLQGGQENRFYSAFVTRDSLFLSNDCPNSDNYLYRYDKASRKPSVITRIENSAFYMCTVGSSLFLSTNAVPPEKCHPITSSPANDLKASHVWMCDLNCMGCRRVMTIPCDLFAHLDPPFMREGTFQYTNAFFPEGDNPTGKLYCYVTGAPGYDDCTLVYDPAAFEATT